MRMRNFNRRRRCILGAALAAPLVPPLVLAQPAQPVPSVEEFFRPELLNQARLSFDGTHVAGIREVDGRRNLVVVSLATRKALIVTNFRDADVGRFGWVSSDRLWFNLYDRSSGSGNQPGSLLHVIGRDGNLHKTLTDRGSWAYLHSVLLDDGQPTNQVIVVNPSRQARGQFSSTLSRVDTVTGRSTLITLGGPGPTQGWVVDRKGVARIAVSTIEDRTTRIFYRASEQDPWQIIFSFDAGDDSSAIEPIEFDADGTLYVSAYAGGDTAAIYRYDAKNNKLDPEPVAAVKGFDLGDSLRFSRDGRRLLGVDYEADRAGTDWIDPDIAGWQAQVDRALPDAVNRMQIAGVRTAPIVLVSSDSDRDPGRYFIFDPVKKTLEQIAASRPWIKPEQMRPVKFFRYEARDGLSIPAQLTLPEGSGKFPLIVLHYGGPWVRPIHWDWDPIVQFLASRGYAVFMPAPRASTGFGRKLYTAGWKQWGLAMQDDVTDGVRKLIKDGIADPKRVCLCGASYGGYLTMMGLAKEPDLFRCGINWIGVTDPSLMFSVTWTDFNRAEVGRHSRELLIGDPEKDREQFKRTSPVDRAAEIKQPVLMAYGGLDSRVPIINGERMRDALKPHNPNVEWIVYPDEGHGWLRTENNVDFWSRVEKFLAKNLAPQS